MKRAMEIYLLIYTNIQMMCCSKVQERLQESEEWLKCWSCLRAKQPAIKSVNCVLTLCISEGLLIGQSESCEVLWQKTVSLSMPQRTFKPHFFSSMVNEEIHVYMPRCLFTILNQFTTWISGTRMPGVFLFKIMPMALSLPTFH